MCVHVRRFARGVPVKNVNVVGGRAVKQDVVGVYNIYDRNEFSVNGWRRFNRVAHSSTKWPDAISDSKNKITSRKSTSGGV